MARTKIFLWCWALAAIFAIPASTWAQTEEALLTQLSEEEQDVLSALVMYPEDVRLNILEAALYPEALIKLERIQELTRTTFLDLLDPYPQEVQEMIWDLARYPDLIHRLVTEADEDNRNINRVLADYPEVIYQRARDANRSYRSLLMETDRLNTKAETAFSRILDEYPPRTQIALRDLIDLPEVLSLLTENIRLTILVGDLYQKNPDWVLHKADSLNLVMARQNAAEIEDWKANLEKDPDAMRELEESARSFGDEYGYDDEYYAYGEDEIYYEESGPVILEYHYYHYPYWFGYPHWFIYPRWRPYPFWWDWGFYYRPGRTVVIIGMPSFYFTNWYFYYPRHLYYYPHLSDRFVHYYYGHRHSVSSITVSVDNWSRQNRAVVTDRWLSREDGRVERLREFGRFEADRRQYNQYNPGRELSQAEYLERNQRKYNRMEGTVEPRQAEQPRARTDERTMPQREVPKPEVRVPPRQRQPEAAPPTPQRGQEPRVIERKGKETDRDRAIPQTGKSRSEIDQIDKARDYHRRTWERERATTQPRPAPQTREQTRQAAPKKVEKPAPRKKKDG